MTTSLPLDDDALAMYERAYRIGALVEGRPRGADDPPPGPPVSFAVAILALLRGTDDLSRWFARTATTLGPKLGLVLAHKKLDEREVDHAPVPTGELPSPLLTVSSRTVLDSACAWAQHVGAPEIGIRHILAAYLITPPANHRNHLSEWETEEGAWKETFFAKVAPLFTSERWVEARKSGPRPAVVREVAGARPIHTKDLKWLGTEVAERVLRNAQLAQLHASAKAGNARSTSIQRLSLLFALVERAKVDATLRDEVAPLWALVDQKPEYEEARARAGLADWTSSPADDFALIAGAALSAEVVNLLETARLLERGETSSPANKVTVLQLLGAYASRRVAADDELLSCGVDVAELRRRIYPLVEPARRAAWLAMMDPEAVTFRARPIKLDSDEPDVVVRADPKYVDDPLLRRADVDSFAALLAAKHLEPPLAIGLFGPWGSGKTTFLRRLRASVSQRVDGATDPRYINGVVQIDFNAWHYAESDLVSSLVDKIFRELDAYLRPREWKPGDPTWLMEKQKELDSARQRAATAQVVLASARTVADAAKQQLDAAVAIARDKQDAIAVALEKAAVDAWDQTKAALADNQQVGALTRAIDDAGGEVKQLRERLAAMRRPGRLLATVGPGAWAVIVAMTIGVPLLAAAFVGRVLDSGDLMKALAALTSVIGTATVSVRWLAGAIGKADDAAALVEAELAARLEKEPTVTAAREGHQKATAAVEAAQATLANAGAEVVRAESALAAAQIPTLVAGLAAQRAGDGTYSKSLGIVSTARDDLTTLAGWLRAQRDDGALASGKRVDRIILYIDDLDRCEADQVVRVLQLTHMLLAFELFVVVVGVDARWIRHALKVHLADVTGTEQVEGAPTPEEYLEKIFQVAFWLEPMNPMKTASFMSTLIRRPDPKVAPESWEVDRQELDFLSALSTQMDISPRRTKRLINVYRLIKARLGDDQLASFLVREGGGPGPFQVALALLVIGVAAGADGPRLLGSLADGRGTLLEVVAAQRKTAGRQLPADVLETLSRTQPELRAEELRGWALLVARYLLHRDQPTAA